MATGVYESDGLSEVLGWSSSFRHLLMKVIFILGCFGLLTTTALGQAQLDIGLKGGGNLASVNSSAGVVSTKNAVLGYHGGIYLMAKFGKVFAIQTEMVYSTEGQSYKYFVAGYPSYSSTFNYINYPILLKFYVAEGFNFQFGPQFGYLNNSRGYTYTANPGGAPTVSSGPLGDYVKAYNVSLCVGAAYDLPFGLNFTLRYNGGLTDINKLTGQTSLLPGSTFGTSSANSSVLQLSVGYRLFKFGQADEY